MNLGSHLSELRKKHQHLSEAIEAEQRAPGSDSLSIAAMKRQKLRLKDQIEKLQHG